MTKVVGGLLASLALAGALAFGMLAVWNQSTTRANPGVAMGIDADPSGNTATYVGSIEPCIRKSTGDTFDVDIYIKDVTDLVIWQANFRYSPAVLNVVGRDVQKFLAATPGSQLNDEYTQPTPDTDGIYELIVSDVAEPPATESGSGVLVRLTLQAMGAGITPATLDYAQLFGLPIPHQISVDSIANAWIAVDQDCPSDPPPTATPSPTPEPSGTAGPSPTPEPTGTSSPTPTPGTPTPTPPPGTVYLTNGWNGACYQGTEQQIADAFSGVDGVRAIYRMKGQTFDRWFPGRPDVSTISTLSPFDPLLILEDEAATWTVSPSADLLDSLTLASGWNSACYLGEGKDTEAAASQIEGDFAIMYSLAPDQSWRRYAAGRPEVSNLDRLDTFTSVLILVTDPEGALWVFNP